MNHPVPSPKRLTRSRDDRVVAGVCGGLARYTGLDPSLVRILTAVLTLVTSGAALLVYVVAVLVVPEEERFSPPPHQVRPPAWQPPAPAPGPAPQDPVWGREGAPWEQPQAGAPRPGTSPGGSFPGGSFPGSSARPGDDPAGPDAR